MYETDPITPDISKQTPNMAIWISSKLYDLKSIFDVDPKLKNVP